MIREPIPKDKKREHAEDLERMSRILRRRSEGNRVSKEKVACVAAPSSEKTSEATSNIAGRGEVSKI